MADGAAVNNNPGHDKGATNRRHGRGRPAVAPVSRLTRNARKLVEEAKVDMLIGPSGLPGSVAMAAVAAEQRVPFVSISPLPPNVGKGEGGFWAISIPQPPPLMVAAVVDQMQKAGIKSL